MNFVKVLGKKNIVDGKKEKTESTDTFFFVFSRVLITTDVWARGIDVQQVSLVIK